MSKNDWIAGILFAYGFDSLKEIYFLNDGEQIPLFYHAVQSDFSSIRSDGVPDEKSKTFRDGSYALHVWLDDGGEYRLKGYFKRHYPAHKVAHDVKHLVIKIEEHCFRKIIAFPEPRAKEE